tara:strand:+ start:1943 stop:2392 length:450 start_codon:yes stop_codon:yes gene_type:complete
MARSYRNFKQGRFTPTDRSKFIGKGDPIYRSSYELKFMNWCDHNPNVIEWGSENVVVPYVHPIDGKVHRYYIDNYVRIREGKNIQTYLIEIKPAKQVGKPVKTPRKQKKTFLKECTTWAINQRKWEYARRYCASKSYKFIILTEKELNI